MSEKTEEQDPLARIKALEKKNQRLRQELFALTGKYDRLLDFFNIKVDELLAAEEKIQQLQLQISRF